MHPALWISKTGLEAQQTDISVISNNLANVNTVGFKRDRANFESLMYQVVNQPGAQSSSDTQFPSGIMLGTGVKTAATQKIFKSGSILQTERPLDIAISGEGFFQVQMPDGTTAYTRNGQFNKDANGQLVTMTGYVVQPAITIPQDAVNVSIGNDGTISVTTAGSTQATTIGTLELANFVNPTGLQPIGQNLYLETTASGSPQTGAPGTTGLGLINGQALEGSNVNVVEELVNMIETQRAYEMNSKAIQTVDAMLQYINQTL